MLEAALEFSRQLVAARMRDNHGKKPIDTYEQDLQAALFVEVKMIIKKINKTIKTKKAK